MTDNVSDGNIDPIEVARRLIGSEGALRLRQAFGGQKIYFPETVKPHSELAQAIGLENAQRLCRELYRVNLYVPVPPPMIDRERVIVWAARAGLPRRLIAHLANCTCAYVYRIIARARAAALLPERGAA